MWRLFESMPFWAAVAFVLLAIGVSVYYAIKDKNAKNYFLLLIFTPLLGLALLLKKYSRMHPEIAMLDKATDILVALSLVVFAVSLIIYSVIKNKKNGIKIFDKRSLILFLAFLFFILVATFLIFCVIPRL